MLYKVQMDLPAPIGGRHSTPQLHHFCFLVTKSLPLESAHLVFPVPATILKPTVRLKRQQTHTYQVVNSNCSPAVCMA